MIVTAFVVLVAMWVAWEATTCVVQAVLWCRGYRAYWISRTRYVMAKPDGDGFEQRRVARRG